MKPLLVIGGFLFFVAWIGLIDYYDSLPEPGTDSGVGCVDDCLDPMDPTQDAEPIHEPEPLPVVQA